jgi:signal transduction histidine kinase
MTDKQQIEPGLFQIFRLINMVIWALLTLSLCSLLNRNKPADYFNILMWAQTSALLLYLWRLRREIDASQLTVALWMATLGPIIAQAVATMIYARVGLAADDIPVDHGFFYLWLLFPLLLVSAQYGMKSMLAFTFGTSLLPVLLAYPLEVAGAQSVHSAAGHAFARLLLFSFVGFIIVRLTHAQRQQRRELADKNAQLMHYATTLEQLAISRERNRLARELHDTLAHTLSAVNVQLSALEVLWDSDPDAARDRLQQTRELTRDGLSEARRSLHALRASPLEDLGLTLAIERQAQQTVERAGLQLRLDLPRALNGLRPEIEQNVYRIAEEAMNNVARHAQATHILVSLRRDGDQVRLVVRDDGLGFDAAGGEPNGHYGLTGMQERAMLVDGDLEIHSEPGRGTQIKLTVETTPP